MLFGTFVDVSVLSVASIPGSWTCMTPGFLGLQNMKGENVARSSRAEMTQSRDRREPARFASDAVRMRRTASDLFDSRHWSVQTFKVLFSSTSHIILIVTVVAAVLVGASEFLVTNDSILSRCHGFCGWFWAISNFDSQVTQAVSGHFFLSRTWF